MGYFLIITLLFSQITVADTNDSLQLVVDHLEDINPQIKKTCLDGDGTSSEGELREVRPDLFFGFVQTDNPSKPFSFYIHTKTAITTSGRPNQLMIDNSQSDLRALNTEFVKRSAEGKSLSDVSLLDANKFIDRIVSYSTEEREDAKIILELTKQKSENDILTALESLTKGYSYERKLHLLASIGGNFNSGYDFSRNDQSKGSSYGDVSMTELFSAIDQSLLTGAKVTAGVCRDMHLAMAKMARAMGLSNAYGLSYQTRSGAHLVLTTTPDSYGDVSIVNYGASETSGHASGAAAFENQDVISSWGQRIEITSGETNRVLIHLPTRLGQVLSRASGAGGETLVFGDDDNTTGIQMGVKSPYGNILFNHQKSTQGQSQEISGVYYQIDKSPYSFLRFNGAVGYMDSTRALSDTKQLESGLYGRYSLTLGDEFDLGNGFSLSALLSSNYSSLSSCRRTTNNPNCVEDDPNVDEGNGVRPALYDFNFISEAALHYRSPNLLSNVGYKTMLQPLKENMLDARSKRSLRQVQQQIYADFVSRFKGFEIGGYGKLNLTDLEDQMIKTYQVGGRAAYNPFGLSVLGEAKGRIDSKGRIAPAWVPGTENKQIYRLTKDLGFGSSNIGFEYQFSEDFPALNSGFIIFNGSN